MAKVYVYHVVDSTGAVIETVPDRDVADTLVNYLETQGQTDLRVIKEHRPQLHGHRMGRDPDLH